MDRKQRKSLFDSKVFWMIISLLTSLAIWSYVVSTENSVVTQVFRGVKVEITGRKHFAIPEIFLLRISIPIPFALRSGVRGG